ncbi:MAG: ATP-binding region, ATPase-like:Histidine kinase, region:Histidine kinase N-terminal [Proteobacteria bacterium]|nr:ATP-binding region, ATPase-like:Histidine kinase, region:Histidine kinase N-terminal [Pseudomonadota bacterium]
MRRILLNLPLHAIGAAEEGGVRLLVEATEKHLPLASTNDGDYIPQERMDTLFEPFAVSSERGHGPGRRIVYQIVQQLDDEIEVERLPGYTTFKVGIPYGHTA